MLRPRLNKYALCLIAIASCFLVFINEFFIYSLYRFSWSSIRCNSGNCSTILLVADPQILGETFEPYIYSSIAIYDSDRFLKNTYSRAFAFSKPDVVCFLGDLMDEGSVANDAEYQRYVQRFHKLFKSNANVQKFHIPGDNDIGGERSDYITTLKTTRFREAFNESDLAMVQNRYRFFNINLLTHKYPEFEDNESTLPSRFLNIVLTHMSVLSYPGLTMKLVLDKFKPNIIFSGHMHLSRVITYPPQNVENFLENGIMTVDLKKGINQKIFTEIMVPTSSYRMGVSNIGYGLAVIDGDVLRYTVLWSPNRLVCLKFYAIWFGFIGLGLAIWILCQHYSLCRRRVTYRFRQRLMIATDTF